MTSTPDFIQKLRRSLIEHEGYSKFPYVDTTGKITIGIGYNLSDRGLDDDYLNHLCSVDMNFFYEKLSEFPWFKELNMDRQVILVDMCFMGWKKFLEFDKLIDALSKHDYQSASNEMLNSEWAKQVRWRALDLAQAMLTGVYDI